jgi:D-serine/D-alanine/glycine transporter
MEESHKLERGLGQRQIEMIAIGGCIGTGLFMGAGKTISLAGPGIIFIYGITGFILYFVMRAMGELLLSNMEYKSFVDFSEDILGPSAGFFVGWSYWFAWIVAAIAEITAITGYVSFWWPDLPHWLPALATITLLMILNILSVKLFGELEFWLSIIKVFAILGLIGIGIWLCTTGFISPTGIKAKISNLWSYGGMIPNGMMGLMLGLQSTIFAFGGIEIIGTMMAESKDPEKMIPDAIRKIPWRIMVFYIGTVSVLMMVTPWDSIPADKSPFVGMFTLVGMVGAASVLNIVVISSATSSSNSGIFATSRMLYGLAKKHHAPAIFGKLSAHQIPTGGVYLGTGLILCVSILLNSMDSIMAAFSLVGSVAAMIFIYIWTMILWAYIVYRKRCPDKHDESNFKMPLGNVMPYVSLAFFALVVYTLTLEHDTRIALYVLPSWFLFLGITYWIKTRSSKKYVQIVREFNEKVEREILAAKEYRLKRR